MLRRGWRVRGRVQGVGFRWATAREARKLGVEGHVQNLGDGSVEVQASGPAAALERLESWLRRGPDGARVDEVERTEALEARPAASGSGFRIR